jgi:uncharacterized protein YjbI with pentapeptide repeats
MDKQNLITFARTGEGSTNFRGADLRDMSLRGLDLSGIDFSFANFNGANFQHCNFTGCTFDNALVEGAKFEYADLTDVSCKRTRFINSSFHGCKPPKDIVNAETSYNCGGLR